MEDTALILKALGGLGPDIMLHDTGKIGVVFEVAE